MVMQEQESRVLARETRVCARAMARHAAEYRAAGCPMGEPVSEKKAAEQAEAVWRRVTGMTVSQEARMDAAERREGIARLVDWIADFLKDDLAAKRAPRTVMDCSLRAELRRKPEALHPAFASLTSALSPTGGEGMREGRDEMGDGVRLDAQMDSSLNNAWACEGQGAELIVRVCRALGISRNTLSELTREYRGISGAELIDGLRVRRVKAALLGRVKAVARELWMSPGHYANVLVSDGTLRVCGGQGGSDFVDRTEERVTEELAETREERMAAFVAAWDAAWRRGDFSRDGFAVELGFRSFSELNRACLNVYGKSARQVASALAEDVLEYYLAREAEELRVLACSLRATPSVAKARYLYHGSTARPEGWMAETSALWDALEPAFRAAMGAEFG